MLRNTYSKSQTIRSSELWNSCSIEHFCIYKCITEWVLHNRPENSKMCSWTPKIQQTTPTIEPNTHTTLDHNHITFAGDQGKQWLLRHIGKGSNGEACEKEAMASLERGLVRVQGLLKFKGGVRDLGLRCLREGSVDTHYC